MWFQRSQIRAKLPIVLGAVIGILILFFLGWRFGRMGWEAIRKLPASVSPLLTEEATEEPEEKRELEEKIAQALEERVEGKYREKAEKGEGLTHLARKVLREYLKANPQNFTVTPEHKIYIEDYLAKKMGGRWLKLGEEVEFSQELIKEAVEKAGQLTSEQLENLKQFSKLVPSLSS